MEFVGAARVERGERQNDQIHDVFHGGAKEQAAYQRVFEHETKFAACAVVDRGGGTGDEIVKDDAEGVGPGTSAVDGLGVPADRQRSLAESSIQTGCRPGRGPKCLPLRRRRRSPRTCSVHPTVEKQNFPPCEFLLFCV